LQKILLYKAASCTRCPIAKFILDRVLSAKGLNYSESVEERDTEKNSDAMAELLMLDSVNTPVLVAGDIVLREEEALKERLVREAVEKWASSKGL
jgi:hypothetical protein